VLRLNENRGAEGGLQCGDIVILKNAGIQQSEFHGAVWITQPGDSGGIFELPPVHNCRGGNGRV